MPKLQPKLVVNAGGMFAGKSTTLMAQGERHMLAGHKVVYIKPDYDSRYSEDEIVTHDGQKVKAMVIKADTKVSFTQFIKMATADVILIDEVQFFTEKIITLVNDLLADSKVVYCSGLDMDYKGEAFSNTATLLGMAEDVNKLKAVCSDCGNDSYVTAKTSGSNNRVELGSKDKYKPVCRECYRNKKGEIE